MVDDTAPVTHETSETTTPVAETPAPDTTTTDEFDPARWKQFQASMRAEQDRLKADLAEARKAQAELDELKRAQETEAERIQRERDEALARAETASEALKRGHLLAELAKPEHGLVDAETVATLLQGVEYDDNGRPVNLAGDDGPLSRLLADKPFLKASPANAPSFIPNVNGGSGGNPAPGPKLTTVQLKAAEKAGMSPEEYELFANVSSLADLEKAGLINPPGQ